MGSSEINFQPWRQKQRKKKEKLSSQYLLPSSRRERWCSVLLTFSHHSTTLSCTLPIFRAVRPWFVSPEAWRRRLIVTRHPHTLLCLPHRMLLLAARSSALRPSTSRCVPLVATAPRPLAQAHNLPCVPLPALA